MVLYISIGVVLSVIVFVSWCLNPLNKRIGRLSERLTNLAMLGEYWHGEAEEIEYYQSQSTISLIRFCYREKNRKFDVEQMVKSDLLKK